VIDHRLSPGATVRVGLGGGESGPVEGCTVWLLGGVESADRFALSEPLESVAVLEGACSGEAAELSGGD